MISTYLPDKEFYVDERCFIVEIHNRSDDESCSIARARVLPGETTQFHAVSGTIERYVILEGVGEVEIDGKLPITVRPLDVVCIRAGASQRIRNAGSADLVFLCVCTPRFPPERYAHLSV